MWPFRGIKRLLARLLLDPEVHQRTAHRLAMEVVPVVLAREARFPAQTGEEKREEQTAALSPAVQAKAKEVAGSPGGPDAGLSEEIRELRKDVEALKKRLGLEEQKRKLEEVVQRLPESCGSRPPSEPVAVESDSRRPSGGMGHLPQVSGNELGPLAAGGSDLEHDSETVAALWKKAKAKALGDPDRRQRFREVFSELLSEHASDHGMASEIYWAKSSDNYAIVAAGIGRGEPMGWFVVTNPGSGDLLSDGGYKCFREVGDSERNVSSSSAYSNWELVTPAHIPQEAGFDPRGDASLLSTDHALDLVKCGRLRPSGGG